MATSISAVGASGAVTAPTAISDATDLAIVDATVPVDQVSISADAQILQSINQDTASEETALLSANYAVLSNAISAYELNGAAVGEASTSSA